MCILGEKLTGGWTNVYARDKSFDRLIKLHKGKVSNRLTIIASRHKESSRVQEKDITALNVNI